MDLRRGLNKIFKFYFNLGPMTFQTFRSNKIELDTLGLYSNLASHLWALNQALLKFTASYLGFRALIWPGIFQSTHAAIGPHGAIATKIVA